MHDPERERLRRGLRTAIETGGGENCRFPFLRSRLKSEKQERRWSRVAESCHPVLHTGAKSFFALPRLIGVSGLECRYGLRVRLPLLWDFSDMRNLWVGGVPFGAGS
jgi:hypothetical protein